MAMHPTAVRFSDHLWRLIQAEAREEGVSASQYIRESVLARVMIAEASRGAGKDWERALRMVRELLSEE